MNKYYEIALKETNTTTAEQMREIAEYCIIDALSCQRLMIKRNVIRYALFCNRNESEQSFKC
jgi:hypothetical protein